jgi:Na+-driven multidrug efflux pump
MIDLVEDSSRREPETESLARETRRLAVAIVLGVVAALALQVWIVVFLGQLGPQALYSRAIYMPIGFVTLAVHEGLAVVAQIHAGISRRTRQEIGAATGYPTFLLIGGGLFAVLAVVLAFAAAPILSGLGVAEGEMPAVRSFLVLMCIANATALVPLLCTATLRGLGRARLSSTLGVTHVLLAALAMMLLENVTALGALSVPAGYLIATAIVGAATVITVIRIGVAPPAWRLRRDACISLWRIALPVAASFLLLAVMSSGYLHVLREVDQNEVIGFSLGQIVQTFLIVPATALGSAAAVAVTGRQAEVRAAINRRGLTALLRMTIPVYALLALTTFLLHTSIVGAVTASPQVAQSAEYYLLWVAPTLALLGPTLAVLTYLEQIGMARSALVLNVTFFAAILAIAMLLPQPVDSSTLTQLIAVTNVIGFCGVQFAAAKLVRQPNKEVHRARHRRPPARHRQSDSALLEG